MLSVERISKQLLLGPVDQSQRRERERERLLRTCVFYRARHLEFIQSLNLKIQH